MYVEHYKMMKEPALSESGAGQHQFTFVRIYGIDRKGTEGHECVEISFVSECVWIFHVVFADIFSI